MKIQTDIPIFFLFHRILFLPNFHDGTEMFHEALTPFLFNYDGKDF